LPSAKWTGVSTFGKPLINTLLVEKMVAFDKAPGLFVMLKITETYETPLLRSQCNAIVAFKGNSNERIFGTLDSEDAWSIGNILLAGHRGLGRP
jgi:hypothetical protein